VGGTIYVNSNHILIYDDAQIARWYASVFAEEWQDEVKTLYISSDRHRPFVEQLVRQ